MSGSAIFDLTIGIVFVFLLVSLICSQVGNKVSTWLRWRSKELEAGILKFIMDGDKGLFDKFYGNALVKSLTPEDTLVTKWLLKSPLKGLVHSNQTPVAIPARTFATVLFNAVIPGAAGTTSIDEIRASIEKMPDNALRSALLSLVTKADTTVDHVRQNIENWFDTTMTKTTVIYQRNMWGFALFIAMLITLILNVDIISIGTRLWQDSALRSAVANSAQDYVKNNDNAKALGELQKLDLPIGWQRTPGKALPIMPADWVKTDPSSNWTKAVIFKLAGWLLTMIAGAQGAPFWFDLLRKLTQRG